eukprot:449011-Prorocentrum_minimum.AAC.3
MGWTTCCGPLSLVLLFVLGLLRLVLVFLLRLFGLLGFIRCFACFLRLKMLTPTPMPGRWSAALFTLFYVRSLLLNS